MRNYELVVIIKPEVSDEDAGAVVDKVKTLVTDRKGEFVESKPWGKKKLAYPIGQYKEGNYFLTRLKLEPGTTKDLDTALKLNEKIMRYLLVNTEG